MSEHTPRPWRHEFSEGTYVRASDDSMICTISHLRGRYGLGGRKPSAESEANARLIAAAPDLLEALLDLLYNGEDDDCRKAAFAAIAKAQGRSPSNSVLRGA